MEIARALTEKLASLLRREHDALAEFLIALADFDRRRLWVDLGHSSLWYFLHRELGLSKSAAQYRKVAAELIQEIPGIVEPLRRGDLCLTSIIEVAKVVTVQNWETVLPRFCGLSRREAAEVVAELQPHPAPPLRTVVTPVRSGTASRNDAPVQARELIGPQPAEAAVSEVRPGEAPPAAVSAAVGSFSLLVSSLAEPDPSRSAPPVTDETSLLAPTAPATSVAPARPQLEVAPLTADKSRLHLTVSQGFLRKLEAASDAMSHAMPGATPSEILEAGLELLLAKADRRRGLVERPQKATRPSKGDGIPAHVRREVWKRDGGRCQWPLSSGGICGATSNLELDHIRPRSMGGTSTADNLRVACKPHNNLAARLLLGDDLMDRYSSGLRGGSNRPERLPRARRSADKLRDQRSPTTLLDRIEPRRPAEPAAGPGGAESSHVGAGWSTV